MAWIERAEYDREHGCWRINDTIFVTAKTMETGGICIVDAEEPNILQEKSTPPRDEAKGKERP